MHDSDTKGSRSGPPGSPPGNPPSGGGDGGWRIAGRYEIDNQRYLGVGGSGTVYRAIDQVKHRHVAIKLFPSGKSPSYALRREVVALRGLPISGVVRLLDEGEDRTQGWYFMVLELIEGAHFPGMPVPAPWHALEPVAVGLLEIVGRVHAAGVLHLDLKPDNVMIDRAGQVVLLDLGFACGPALGGAASQRSRGGTRSYAAPEQIETGDISERSDLYAVGVMLWEALTGFLPPAGEPLPPGPIGDAPAPVAALIRALLVREPAQRPASAWGALDGLLAELGQSKPAWTPRLSEGTDLLPVADLRACFRGLERLFHVPTDAAALLHQRTGGQRDRVVEELRRWVRMGLVVPEEGRLHMERAALDKLEAEAALESAMQVDAGRAPPAAAPDAWPSRDDAAIMRLITAGRYDEVPATARAIARKHLPEGRFDLVRMALEPALVSIRRGLARPEEETALLVLWARMAFEQRIPKALELALDQVERAVVRTDEIEDLERLLRSAQRAECGENSRARELLVGLAPLAEPSLELLRHWVWMRLAFRAGNAAAAQALAAMDTWVRAHGTGDALAHVLDWRARLLYRENRFEESARLQAEAAHRARWRTVRLGCMLNSASAWMEAGNYVAAEDIALAVLEDAVARRYALYEARAEWLLRSMRYRIRWQFGAGDQRVTHELVPDTALVDAVTRLEVPYLAGMVCLNEAAVAWRNGDLDTGRELAKRAHTQFAAGRRRDGRVLARALQLVCLAEAGALATGDGDVTEEIDALAREVEEPIGNVSWQVLGMLARLPGGAHLQADANRLAGKARRPDLCRELLAPREVTQG